MRLPALTLAVAFLFTGCQPDQRADGDTPQQTTADDYEQDAYEATTGSEGTVPLSAPEDTMAVREALGNGAAAE